MPSVLHFPPWWKMEDRGNGQKSAVEYLQDLGGALLHRSYPMDGYTINTIALIGGVLPSLVWLVFWLREDRCEPEPKLRLALTFLSGMASVYFVLYIERWISPFASGVTLLLLWAIVEELFKLGAATIFGLASPAYDEPIDAIIYMVTAALGFAAAENMLFLLQPLHNDQLFTGIVTDDLRFIGATLLHTLTSATIGLCMAFSYFKSAAVRRAALAAGVILAIFLHTLFNFFILQMGDSMRFSVFLSLWAGIILVLFLVERTKLPSRDVCQ